MTHPMSRLALALTLSGFTAACGGTTAPPAETPAASTPRTSVEVTDADASAAGITAAAVRLVERSEPLTAPGVVTFDERRVARIGARVEGVVDEVPVQVGDRVAAGTVLAHLHSHVVHDAWAAYFTALAGRRRSETELAYARTAESRAAQLVKDKALSPQELERAQTERSAAEQAVRAAQAEVTRAEQELRHYGIVPSEDADPTANDDIPVTAPFAGSVIERLVTPGAAVTPGTPLLVVADLSRLWITAEVDEARLGRLVTGREVSVTTAAYPGNSFTGTLTAVGDVINPETRRVTLRIEIPNPDRRLKPQMFVTVALGATAPRRVAVVPSAAVQSLEGESVVFVRTVPNRYDRRSVRIGTDLNGEIEIVEGLREGDMVAITGAFLLKSELAKPAGGEGE
jgi:cobalt-zinc-cadmium efflux system membrane fusion protein